jgi:sugar fermentation stimulation protein A
MKYDKIVKAIFIERPNRFIARVKIDGSEEVESVHVKNTGRCRELLLRGAEVILEDCIEKNPNRKTRYDLIAVKKNMIWVNIDSQAPNKVVKEWLMTQGYDCIKPEYTFGNSRMDFYMEKGKQKYLMEVKGCTLEIDGVGYFPDAPTERGVKHLRELAAACGQGYKCLIAFVIQMEEISEVRPNTETHPEFGAALHEAKAAGVEVLFLKCHVGMDRLEIIGEDES